MPAASRAMPAAFGHKRGRPTLLRALRWLFVSLLLFGPRGAPAVHAADAEPTAFRPPLVVVHALGPLDPQVARMACRSLLEAYPVRCKVGEGRSLPAAWAAWNPERAQLDARTLLDLLFAQGRDPAALIELDLTHVDIYEGNKPFVFGLASLTDRVAVVSLARVTTGGPQFEHRLSKLVRHEVAHTLGLHHHDDTQCVMRQDPTVGSLDTAPTAPCEGCRQHLDRRARAVARPGQADLDRALGHIVRGDVLSARATLVRSFRAGHGDLVLLEDFATVFLEGGHYDEAIEILRYVVARGPARAEVQLKLGLAFHQRGAEGDHLRAAEQLEGVLARHPEWAQLHPQLETLRAQGPVEPR